VNAKQGGAALDRYIDHLQTPSFFLIAALCFTLC